MAYDQQKLRQFYLTQGYADFRVTSAVAELTPDKKDFIITYVVEEGPRYKFGDVTVDSDIRDFDNKKLAASLGIKKGEWYDAKRVETSVDNLNQTAGLFGYAFTDVNPEFNRDKDTLTMSINFHIAEAKRTYVERIDINGNTNTKDKVIRREIRLAEGDAFNSFQVKRSQDRINSLGYFQEKFEIKQVPGSAPDRVVLEANVEEKSTGELSLSAGYSSLEKFIIQASITPAQFPRHGPGIARQRQLFVLFEIGRARLYRALSVRLEHRAGRRHFPARLQRVQLYRHRSPDDLYPGVDRLPGSRRRPADRILARSPAAMA